MPQIKQEVGEDPPIPSIWAANFEWKKAQPVIIDKAKKLRGLLKKAHAEVWREEGVDFGGKAFYGEVDGEVLLLRDYTDAGVKVESVVETEVVGSRFENGEVKDSEDSDETIEDENLEDSNISGVGEEAVNPEFNQPVSPYRA